MRYELIASSLIERCILENLNEEGNKSESEATLNDSTLSALNCAHAGCCAGSAEGKKTSKLQVDPPKKKKEEIQKDRQTDRDRHLMKWLALETSLCNAQASNKQPRYW